MPEPPVLPVIASAPLSVVLLAHNEETHLRDIVASWREHLDRLQRPYELLVADAGSTDHTEVIVQGIAAGYPALRFVRDPRRGGLGAAFRAGVAAAQHPLLLTTTCDRQYQPGDLRLLLAEIDKVHLVSGYRRWLPVPSGLRMLGAIWRGLIHAAFTIALDPLPGWLGWKGHLHALLLRALFGVRLRDVGCAFRLFRRSVFARIPIQSNGVFALDEVLAKANFLGAVMMDVPVSYQARPASDNHESFSQALRDGQRVFSHPTFGPAVLPPGTAETGTI